MAVSSFFVSSILAFVCGAGDGSRGAASATSEPLAEWVRSDFATSGPVVIEGSTVRLDAGAPLSGVTWAGDAPPTEGYELTLDAERVQGSDFFCGLTFPVATGHATLILGGWGGALVGLSCIDGKDASENETTQYRGFEARRKYRVRVRVDDRVRAWIDDAPVVDVAIAGHAFTVRPEVVASVPLGIASYATTALIGDVRLRRLSAAPPADLDASLPAALRGLGLSEGDSPTKTSDGWARPRRVVLPAMTDEWRARFAAAAPDVELVFAASGAEALEAVKGADAIVQFCSADIVAAGDALRWIQLGSAGVERYLEIDALAESDVVLTNAQRLYGPQMAEHVLALLFAFSRGLELAVPLTREGRWDRGAVTGRARLIELSGKTLFVVGLGGIGVEVARRAHALGMRVVATRRSSREGPEFVDYVGLPAETLALAGQADVVVNCAPLTRETERLFDARFFDAMKPSAIFINVGRGKSVDTDALVQALRAGKIGAAGLDVTDPEPLPAGHPLWTFENVIITPHMAAQGDDPLERRLSLYVENVRRFVAGEPLLSVVDKRAGY